MPNTHCDECGGHVVVSQEAIPAIHARIDKLGESGVNCAACRKELREEFGWDWSDDWYDEEDTNG